MSAILRPDYSLLNPFFMRIVEIAKRIGVSTQELRHELGKIDFGGVKATDRDIPKAIAMGIIRMLRAKYPDRIPLIEDDEDSSEIPTEEAEKKSTEVVEEEKTEKELAPKVIEKAPEQKNLAKKKKQSIDNIKFIKLPEIEKKPEAKVTPARQKKFTKLREGDNRGKKDKFRKRMRVKTAGAVISFKTDKKFDYRPLGPLTNLALEKANEKNKKTKKRVRITHKLTLDNVEGNKDVASLESVKYDEEQQRELLKAQKKIKSKSHGDKKVHTMQVQIKTKTGIVEIPETISIKEFAEKSGIQVPRIISVLMKNGILANINQPIDFDTAALVASEFNLKLKKEAKEASSEELLSGDLENLLKDDPEHLKIRPPIVTIMGHVDHGKTTLLDTIRNTSITKTEAGGITQHIGAYQIIHNDKKISFIDTPGHKAFTEMRARGAKVTDIAILVVAADEGIKPQTIEAINHAREAKVPIIVAINKIDKENANLDRIKGELAEHDLTPEDWGGKTITAPLSALTGEGIDQLLEMILLLAEMSEFKANPNRPAVGVVIESKLNPSLGPTATVIVKTGTLSIMDNIIVGESIGRIKVLENDKGKSLKKTGPSGVVKIVGMDKVPPAGSILQVMRNEKEARKKLAEIQDIQSESHSGGENMIMQKIMSKIQAGKLESLKIILKADTKGSLEAVSQEIMKIEHAEVVPKIIHSGVGGITESDIMMASASQAVVIGFHVLPHARVNAIAEKEGVDVRLYKIIYEITDDITKILTGMLKPEIIEKITGHAEVKQIFLTKRTKMIVGCRVTDGEMEAKSKVRITRGKEMIGEGTIGNLKRINEDVKLVKNGEECGIEFESKTFKLEEGDILEGYKMEEKTRSL